MERPIPSYGKALIAACLQGLFWTAAPASAHLLNMTEARLELDGAAGTAVLALQIDLLRTLDSPAAYLAFAKDIDRASHREVWAKMAGAIRLRQGDQRLPLAFASARGPEPFDPGAFEDPFQWPRVWVTFSTTSYDRDRPVQMTFTRDFVFEEPIALTIDNGTERLSRWLVTGQPSPTFAAAAATGESTLSGQREAQDYFSTLRAGFSHILPGGFDHLMFVLTMLLLCRSLAQMAMLVTAFTIGHSLSLALAGFRLVSVPAGVVEPLILLSVCAYALLALRDTQGTFAHHYLMVSGVGLLHGLGFAAAFTQLAWTEEPIPHLVSFNLGIEIAQLLFVLAAYPILARYRPYLRKPLAGVLAVLPLLWLPTLL